MKRWQHCGPGHCSPRWSAVMWKNSLFKVFILCYGRLKWSILKERVLCCMASDMRDSNSSVLIWWHIRSTVLCIMKLRRDYLFFWEACATVFGDFVFKPWQSGTQGPFEKLNAPLTKTGLLLRELRKTRFIKAAACYIMKAVYQVYVYCIKDSPLVIKGC